MAALEMHRGPEPGGCVWGGERADLLDSFDSEMQEWEDQLQDMQRKIEELYNEVKARREASETNTNNVTNNKSLDITLLPVKSDNGHQPNGYYEPSNCHKNSLPAQQFNGVRDDPLVLHSFGHTSDYCNISNNYTSNPLSNARQYPDSCHGQGATLDILNGYLQNGLHVRNNQGNIGPPNMSPRLYPVQYSNKESKKTSPVTNRTPSCVVMDAFEDAENRNNKKSTLDESQARHVSWKEPISSNDLPPKNSASKLPVKQRDSPHVPPRSNYHESSQQPDRKCLLADRKCGSPSVLRKFGAMLQENEGKTLIEDGLVTTVISAELPKCPGTPICQRKFDAGRASTRGPVQKSLTDCDVPKAELESGQAAVPSRHMLLNGDTDSRRGGLPLEQCAVAFNLSQSQSQLKAGHHKKVQGPKPHKTGFQGEDIFSDYRMVERILGAGSQHHGKIHTGLGVGNQKNLEQLLEMMEVENTRSQRAVFTQQRDTTQASRESSPAPSRSNFSRPARPANQRPPSRWAKQTPPSKITPMSCPPSPRPKGRKQFLSSFSLHTETVIM